MWFLGLPPYCASTFDSVTILRLHCECEVRGRKVPSCLTTRGFTVKHKFNLKQTVVAKKSAKTGTVVAIHANDKGIHYDVTSGANASKPHRYLEADLMTENESRKASVIRKPAAAPVAKVTKKAAAKPKAAKPAKKVAKKLVAKKPESKAV